MKLILVFAWSSVAPFVLMWLMGVTYLLFKRVRNNKYFEWFGHLISSVALINSFIWGYLFLRMLYGFQ